MTHPPQSPLQQALETRFTDAPSVPPELRDDNVLAAMAARGSCRDFTGDPVPDDVLATLCAVALSSPTKSDLQQRDIVILRSADQRAQLVEIAGSEPWAAKAPTILVFCGNNRRQRLLHDWHAVPFANDHLDAFFNAAVDAGIAMQAFVTAAEALGLGCCPISAVRNDAAAVSDLLGLPDHVFPCIGLAVGYPAAAPRISRRLPLDVTVHHDRYDETGLRAAVEAYDHDRAQVQPYATQRYAEEFGGRETYGWSDDKVRQYSRPERAGFRRYVRDRGFKLD